MPRSFWKNGAAEAEAFRQDGSLGGSCASSSDGPLFDIPSPPPPPLYGACICRGPSFPSGSLCRAVFQRRNDRLPFRAASKSSNSQKFLAEILDGTWFDLEQARRGTLRENAVKTPKTSPPGSMGAGTRAAAPPIDIAHERRAPGIKKSQRDLTQIKARRGYFTAARSGSARQKEEVWTK